MKKHFFFLTIFCFPLFLAGQTTSGEPLPGQGPSASRLNQLRSDAENEARQLEAAKVELERSVRRYLERRDNLASIIVVTSPVLEPGLDKLKDTSHVSIPRAFYKAILNLEEEKGFAFRHTGED